MSTSARRGRSPEPVSSAGLESTRHEALTSVHLTHPNLRADVRMILSFLARFGIIVPPLEPEQRVLSELVAPGQVAIDIGANVGSYTLELSTLVGPAGRVIAFEPYSPSVARLKELIRFVGADNVLVVQRALRERPYGLRLTTPMKAFGGSLDGFVHLSQAEDSFGEEVEGTSLDSELQRLGVQDVAFIKCDVEGAEWFVFEGAKASIRSFKPVILCEIEDKWSRRFNHSAEEVIELVCELGNYRTAVLEGEHLIPASEAKKAHHNYFFLHPGYWDHRG